jgi:hypothetical protein
LIVDSLLIVDLRLSIEGLDHPSAGVGLQSTINNQQSPINNESLIHNHKSKIQLHAQLRERLISTPTFARLPPNLASESETVGPVH